MERRSGEDEPKPDRITSHEFHALASSWAYTCHVALEDVLLAAFCHPAGIFQNHYLRDLTPITIEMSTLGTVKASV